MYRHSDKTRMFTIRLNTRSSIAPYGRKFRRSMQNVYRQLASAMAGS